MLKHSFFRAPTDRSRIASLVLGVCLALGAGFGIWSSVCAGEQLISTMHMAASSHVSMIGSLSAAALPFLFSAFAAYLGRPVLLIPIAFGKAFFFSYVTVGLLTAWASAGWLVVGLMCFGSMASMPLLCWYWLRCLQGHGFERGVFCLTLGCFLVIGIVDHCLIVPFLAGIIN